MKIFNIPGWKNSGNDHWQSHWERHDSRFERIEQANWLFPNKTEWVSTIAEVLTNNPGALVTCHSIGCIALAHVVAEYDVHIKGAMLVAPSDCEKEGYPEAIRGFSPIPLDKFAFRSIVVTSNNDQAVSIARAKFFAQSWGSELILLKEAGHIEPKSGFGTWIEGLNLIESLESRGS